MNNNILEVLLRCLEWKNIFVKLVLDVGCMKLSSLLHPSDFLENFRFRRKNGALLVHSLSTA